MKLNDDSLYGKFKPATDEFKELLWHIRRITYASEPRTAIEKKAIRSLAKADTAIYNFLKDTYGRLK